MSQETVSRKIRQLRSKFNQYFTLTPNSFWLGYKTALLDIERVLANTEPEAEEVAVGAMRKNNAPVRPPVVLLPVDEVECQVAVYAGSITGKNAPPATSALDPSPTAGEAELPPTVRARKPRSDKGKPRGPRGVAAPSLPSKGSPRKERSDKGQPRGPRKPES